MDRARTARIGTARCRVAVTVARRRGDRRPYRCSPHPVPKDPPRDTLGGEAIVEVAEPGPELRPYLPCGFAVDGTAGECFLQLGLRRGDHAGRLGQQVEGDAAGAAV